MKKHNGGFSLIEVLVAISILAIILVPTGTGLVMSFRMNAKANQLMQAELAVSSAVEELMASGIEQTSKADIEVKYPVSVTITPAYTAETAYFAVTVTSDDPEADSIIVETQIRNAVSPKVAEDAEEEGGEAVG